LPRERKGGRGAASHIAGKKKTREKAKERKGSVKSILSH